MEDSDVEESASLLNARFVETISAELKIPAEIIKSLPYGSDWMFIVKLHAMIEAALNHLIIEALGDARLSGIITMMDTGDRSTGKMAFLKALELIPKEARQFVTMLSKLRNKLVHDINNYEFTLAEWMAKKSSSERADFRDSLKFICPWFEIPDDDPMRSVASGAAPKFSILFGGLAIIGMAAEFSIQKFTKLAEEEAKRLAGLISSYEAGKTQSTPKEQ